MPVGIQKINLSELNSDLRVNVLLLVLQDEHRIHVTRPERAFICFIFLQTLRFILCCCVVYKTPLSEEPRETR